MCSNVRFAGSSGKMKLTCCVCSARPSFCSFYRLCLVGRQWKYPYSVWTGIRMKPHWVMHEIIDRCSTSITPTYCLVMAEVFSPKCEEVKCQVFSISQIDKPWFQTNRGRCKKCTIFSPISMFNACNGHPGCPAPCKGHVNCVISQRLTMDCEIIGTSCRFLG